jgi:glucose/arabinose dehydrogenase
MYATGTNLTDVAWAGDGRAVIVRKDGGVIIRRADETTVVRTGLFGTVDSASEKGLLGVVAHPDVATNGTFFFYVSNGSSNDDKHRVYRGVLDASDQLTIETNTPLIGAAAGTGPGLRASSFGNHDGGGLFIHNRQLYVSVGDSGDNATPPSNKYSSCLNLGNGKILRVNLDGTVPTDNPLANQAMVTSCTSTTGAWSTAAPDRRIFAWGLRNPWRFWVDPQTGLMWIGDVGEMTREEISVGPAGSHFGYPFSEGTEDYEGDTGRGADGSLANMHCMSMTPSRTCAAPVHDYARSGGSNCVIGGLIPEGCGWSTALGGTLYYLFADHGGGWIRALTVRADRMGVMSSTPTNFGTFSGASPRSFRMGPDESLYVVMSSSIHRFTPRDRTGCMGMGGMGGASGMGGRGGAGRGGDGGANAGTGATAGAGGAGMGGVAAGGQAGAVSPGGTGSGGGPATGGMAMGGSGATSGASGTSTGGAAPSGGTTANGGAPAGGVPGAGVGAAPGAGADAGGDGDAEGGCGCRAARGGGLGYLALFLGLVFAIGARLRRRRRGE